MHARHTFAQFCSCDRLIQTVARMPVLRNEIRLGQDHELRRIQSFKTPRPSAEEQKSDEAQNDLFDPSLQRLVNDGC
jgi:hypothetical protein